jgi:hypothetical protein
MRGPCGAKEEMVLVGMLDRLIEIGKERSNVMRISGPQFPEQTMINQKQLENVECFSYLVSVIKTDARCTRETNPGLPRQKQH